MAPASTGAPSAADKAQDLIQRSLQPLLAKVFEKDDMDKLDALADVAVKARPALEETHTALSIFFSVSSPAKLLSPDVDIRREILTPLDVALEPDSSEFLLTLKSISTKREMASLLRHYGAQDLARKVFGMTTLMKRLLDKYRTSEASNQ
ncbi:Hypothetical protein PHPALM_2895, partial [Phytophthora palmivora]